MVLSYEEKLKRKIERARKSVVQESPKVSEIKTMSEGRIQATRSWMKQQNFNTMTNTQRASYMRATDALAKRYKELNP